MARFAPLALALLTAAPALAQCDPEILSHRGGAPQCLDRVANRLHCVFGDEFRVIDITTLASPQQLGSVILPAGDARDIAVASGYAYIVAGFNGLIVVDVSTPASPTVVATIPVAQSVNDIVIANGRAFVCGELSSDDRVFILDLSAPAAPVVAGIYHVSDSHTTGIAARGNILYAAGSSDVDIVDVTNPAAPIVRAIYQAEAFMEAIAVAGDTLFLETVVSLEIVDVSNSSAPTQLSTYETDTWGLLAVNPAGTRAYVEGFSDVDIIDVTTPTSPQHLGTIEYTNGADLLATGTNLFQADSGDGLVLWDCASPASPQQTWSIDLRPTSPTGFDANDSWLVYAENSELIVFDTTVPGSPVRIAVIPLASNSARVVLSGDLLYETDRDIGLQVFDLAAPGGPVVIGSAPTGLYPENLALDGSLLLVALLDGTLQVFDVSNPAAPFLQGSVLPPTPDTTADLVTADGYAFMLRFQTGVNIFDVHNPASPLFLRTIATDDAYDISLHASTLCISKRNILGAADSILFYDVSDPSTPVYRGVYVLAYPHSGYTAFLDSTLVVCDSGTGLHFLDISDPAAPRLVRDFPMGSGAADVVPTSDRLWIRGSGTGLWETTLPGDPRAIASPPDTQICAGFVTTLHADTAGATAFFWRRDGVPLLNGPTGHGSIIAGAFTDTLVIAATRIADAGDYDCTLLNTCGFVRTTPATLSVTTCCAADFNHDSVINSADFFAFIAAFFAADPAADLNADGSLTSQDFFDFVGAFFAGC